MAKVDAHRVVLARESLDGFQDVASHYRLDAGRHRSRIGRLAWLIGGSAVAYALGLAVGPHERTTGAQLGSWDVHPLAEALSSLNLRSEWTHSQRPTDPSRVLVLQVDNRELVWHGGSEADLEPWEASSVANRAFALRHGYAYEVCRA